MSTPLPKPSALTLPNASLPLPILDPCDVLLAAYDQLTLHQAHLDAATRLAHAVTPVNSASSHSTRTQSSPPALSAPFESPSSHFDPHATLLTLRERALFRPIDVTLRLTDLTLTAHATLPCYYAEKPLVGLDAHCLVILTREFPSRNRPPAPCAFTIVHLPVPVDPSRCTAAFSHGQLGVRILRA